MLRVDEIKRIVKEHGAAGYLKLQDALLRGRQQPNGEKIEPVRPERFSIRALWEALVGPCESTLGFVQDQMGYVEMPLREEVTSGAFPSAVGQLINARVIQGYEDNAGFIGSELVEVVPSKLRGERFVGFTTLQGPKVVEEGETYQDSSFAEKFVGSRETKRGRILSISEEAIHFDQTGQILSRAQNLGQAMLQDREFRIVRGVIDADSGEALYAPGGTAEQLYSTGNNNLLTTNTPLVDWTDIQEAMAHHALNTTDDRQADDALAAQPIVWMPRIILTAMELQGTVLRIVNATETRHNNTIAGNTAQVLAPGLRSLSSPIIDQATDGDQWDDASDWLIGDFKRQFAYKEIWPIQTFRAPAQNEEQFERDIVARFKVREYGDIIAVDERFVVKVNAA